MKAIRKQYSPLRIPINLGGYLAILTLTALCSCSPSKELAIQQIARNELVSSVVTPTLAANADSTFLAVWGVSGEIRKSGVLYIYEIKSQEKVFEKAGTNIRGEWLDNQVLLIFSAPGAIRPDQDDTIIKETYNVLTKELSIYQSKAIH